MKLVIERSEHENLLHIPFRFDMRMVGAVLIRIKCDANLGFQFSELQILKFNYKIVLLSLGKCTNERIIENDEMTSRQTEIKRKEPYSYYIWKDIADLKIGFGN